MAAKRPCVEADADRLNPHRDDARFGGAAGGVYSCRAVVPLCGV